MKIAIVGNCQVIGLTKCMGVNNPDLSVAAVFAPDREGFRRVVADSDLVFAQSISMDDHVGEMDEASRSRIHLFPPIAFSAFHPDLVYINRNGSLLNGVMSGYHSIIVFAAFLRGLDAAETENLFCGEMFRQFGFFDYWRVSTDILLAHGRRDGFPLEERLAEWSRRGRFMHSSNHPRLFVLASMSEQMLRQANVEVKFRHADEFLSDNLIDMPVWPVYPDMAMHLGIPEQQALFKGVSVGGGPFAMFTLREFITRSFDLYRQFPADELSCSLSLDHILNAIDARPKDIGRSSTKAANPYTGLAPERFWRHAVAKLPANDVDPVSAPPYRIEAGDKVATAGSCFAQHISTRLQRAGFGFLDVEPSPATIPEARRRDFGYGVYSARFGNVYSSRQLVQLFDRATGTFVPEEEPWLRPDGNYSDPFRPEIQPGGFASLELLVEDRRNHLASVLHMFASLDVFVFTLGLSEAWRSRRDGAIFPLAPGVVAGEWDPERYEFVNFTVADVVADLMDFFKKLKALNSRAKMILTVSPVPLIATYDNVHVLTATTYSKSVLRVAASEVSKSSSDVCYFPSYEIITGNYNRGAYYEDDLRSIKPEGVEHVMRLFMKHYAGVGTDKKSYSELEKLFHVICDEELIEKSLEANRFDRTTA